MSPGGFIWRIYKTMGITASRYFHHSSLKEPFVNLKPVLKFMAHYILLIGERSNGKTTSVLDYILYRKAKFGEEAAYFRRWDTDVKPKNSTNLFDSIVERGLVKKYTKGEWTNIIYYGGSWYLEKETINEKNKVVKVRDEKPFMRSFTIADYEHRKGTSYPKIRTILFDEFISSRGYLPDEFMFFMNAVSTIVRLRDDITIFMCGNAINPYSPYFREMGLGQVRNMNRGEIQLIDYGEKKLRVCVYMTDTLPKDVKKSNVYFQFENPRLSTITGEGAVWDLAIYPHCPCSYKTNNILFNFFIQYYEELFHGEIIYTDKMMFIYFHLKTSPIQKPEKDLIYTLDNSPLLNTRKYINRPTNHIEKIIYTLILQDKVFYQDNEVGNSIANFFRESRVYSRL